MDIFVLGHIKYFKERKQMGQPQKSIYQFIFQGKNGIVKKKIIKNFEHFRNYTHTYISISKGEKRNFLEGK
jgi:hypothetical protein